MMRGRGALTGQLQRLEADASVQRNVTATGWPPRRRGRLRIAVRHALPTGVYSSQPPSVRCLAEARSGRRANDSHLTVRHLQKNIKRTDVGVDAVGRARDVSH